MFKNIGTKLNTKFLWGIGGLGDFLLIMSDGNYDSYDELGLVFWANNPPIIKELTKQCFPKITKSIITENYLGSYKARDYYQQIVNDPMFLSKAHIPSNLEYVKEWSKVIDVFDKYNINKHPLWINDWLSNETENVIISPLGGSSDRDWKKKIIKKELLFSIIDKCETKPLLISTEKEMEYYLGYRKSIEERCMLIYDWSFEDLFSLIVNSKIVYSVDSWVKTLSMLAGVDTVLIESYYDRDLPKDPGDNIFIENWEFVERIKQ